MKKLLILSIFVFLVCGFGCQKTPVEEVAQILSEPAVVEVEEDVLKETVYTTFVINTHDWVNPEQSITTLNRIIDLHEKYQLPVDIYLDDPVFQIYEEQAPDLIERLKSSRFVAVSYHVRPPYPYYWGFDWLGLDKMSVRELGEIIEDYEEHRIDLSTGELLEEPGGYEHLKDLMGYAPYVVGSAGSTNKERQAVTEIYKNKGAQFIVSRSETSSGWGESQEGLWIRPEDTEVKVYEPRGHKTGEQFLLEALEEVAGFPTAFVNLKWHENNFYTWFTPWGEVYYTDQTKEKTLRPAFDLAKGNQGTAPKTEEEQNEQWNRYEECLIYLKAHPEIFTVINARDLAEMVE